MEEFQNAINKVVTELRKYDKTNTVVMHHTGLSDFEKEKAKEYLEIIFSGMSGRSITVIFANPDKEHPEGTCHLAYYEENAKNGEKLTLADAFKYFTK